MKKLFIVLTIAILILSACGTGNSEGSQGMNDRLSTGSGGNGVQEGNDSNNNDSNHNDDKKDEDTLENEGDSSEEMTSELVPNLENEVLFQYVVFNDSQDTITMSFSSGQRFDYSVETTAGEQLFLYSSVAVFMQMEGEEVIHPGEQLDYDIDLNELDLESGDYVLTAWMTPKEGEVFETSFPFTVE
ncbi:BsuPI-related putative proteinase inhibitor [Evansella sp. AB-P1]|uniref:BsuPI-related putative proteinase inhibitor n=1 Tax=Evansella sp. AB-P1 TaxID=3037653 RepID=UPI00241EF4D6|nr:BsuPI-related putative proteinase inhibitor [Evansella sp. AB-P1]MDG5786789.1 BsuPI-related putative proteinase inhibitor [Evansella sp. AB-P1]